MLHMKDFVVNNVDWLYIKLNISVAIFIPSSEEGLQDIFRLHSRAFIFLMCEKSSFFTVSALDSCVNNFDLILKSQNWKFL